MSKLILASGSSRRHFLLNQLYLDYCVSIPDINETVSAQEVPEEYARRMARTKALCVFEAHENDQMVLAADTIISLAGEIIGKPTDIQHAKDILRKLSSVEHVVMTAMCLKYQDDMHESIVTTKVKFKLLTSMEIDTYCLTDEPYDKAGAYAIQGLASSFIEYISGSYTNVMGLPLLELREILRHAKLHEFKPL